MPENQRLVDCRPRWITWANAGANVRFYFGVSFQCPLCQKSHAVHFEPPIDSDGLLNKYGPDWSWKEKQHLYWTRLVGETFETLCLSPSIKAGDCAVTIHNGELIAGLSKP